MAYTKIKRGLSFVLFFVLFTGSLPAYAVDSLTRDILHMIKSDVQSQPAPEPRLWVPGEAAAEGGFFDDGRVAWDAWTRGEWDEVMRVAADDRLTDEILQVVRSASRPTAARRRRTSTPPG